MTTTEQLTNKPNFTGQLRNRILFGAGIGLVAISVFVIGAGAGDPQWGPYWRIKPLLLTPFLGAIVGLCYDVTEPLRKIEGWVGKMFYVLSVLGYLIGMWMSLILGLAGTMWD
ncbi:potassium transporter KefB [Mucilaginibacter myungsuensis]|uniref:Potassium transporter KefB n=1 Tax=Mucilaginibacter myungsuensis TaxID=649104 RepID=A0A929PY37_9SPHI|nr:potassium transporter KefB [Mucilaginibacter myungsuensis]MBE9664488.1 potassium transporter KefB [Mucilaginibacter myungsuensis]MDN3601367.1 hypothetical protein [Mucilaginibacter myungsuensis]